MLVGAGPNITVQASGESVAIVTPERARQAARSHCCSRQYLLMRYVSDSDTKRQRMQVEIRLVTAGEPDADFLGQADDR